MASNPAKHTRLAHLLHYIHTTDDLDLLHVHSSSQSVVEDRQEYHVGREFGCGSERGEQCEWTKQLS